MKKLNLLLFVAFSIIFVFNACKKELISSVINSPVKTPLDTVEGAYVLTPEGLALKSHVHLIEPGYHLNVRNGHVFKIKDKTGETMADFGEFKRRNATSAVLRNTTPTDNKIVTQQLPIPKGITGAWQAYASTVTSGNVISSLNTTWVVPQSPVAVNDNQTVFIWDGVQDDAGDDVIQPVLQWGPSAAGGG